MRRRGMVYANNERSRVYNHQNNKDNKQNKNKKKEDDFIFLVWSFSFFERIFSFFIFFSWRESFLIFFIFFFFFFGGRAFNKKKTQKIQQRKICTLLFFEEKNVPRRLPSLRPPFDRRLSSPQLRPSLLLERYTAGSESSTLIQVRVKECSHYASVVAKYTDQPWHTFLCRHSSRGKGKITIRVSFFLFIFLFIIYLFCF